MTIKIRKGLLFLYIWCPTPLIGILVKKWAKHAPEQDLGCNLKVEVDSEQQIKDLTKAIKSAKKYHRKLELLNICSSDGTKVKITL